MWTKKLIEQEFEEEWEKRYGFAHDFNSLLEEKPIKRKCFLFFHKYVQIPTERTFKDLYLMRAFRIWNVLPSFYPEYRFRCSVCKKETIVKAWKLKSNVLLQFSSKPVWKAPTYSGKSTSGTIITGR